MEPIEHQAADLLALQEKRDAAVAEAEGLKREFKVAEQQYLDRIEAAGVTGITINGRQLVKAETEYAQIQDRGEFVRWAQEHRPDLIEVKERKQDGILNQLVHQLRDDGEPLPPGLGSYVKRYVSNRAA